jgi:hypothetical protein
VYFDASAWRALSEIGFFGEHTLGNRYSEFALRGFSSRRNMPEILGDLIGGAEEDRTPDLLIANETLSQLSYGPTPLEGREL